MSAAGQQNEAGIDFEGKHYTLYEATQRQRSLERGIRKTKRKILIDEATGDAEKLQWDQIRLVRTREEYHRFSKAAGLPEQYERMEKAGFTWKHGKAAEKSAKVSQNTKKPIAKANKSAIMKVNTGGNRNEIPLTDAQIKDCVDYAVSLGVDKGKIRYGNHYNTAYGSVFDVVYIGTDVYPSPNGKTANQKLSYKAALAHEIIGHREACIKGTSLRTTDEVLDEVQASIRAARFAEGLSKSERIMLLRDAVERLRKDGRSIRDVKHLLDIESR